MVAACVQADQVYLYKYGLSLLLLRTGETKERMTKGRTCLILKDESKGKEVSNFRPITCLPLMWKI